MNEVERKAKALERQLHDWNAIIEETPTGDGIFRAVLRDVPIEVVSRDPEHDLCHAMINAGLADGSIQFWRGTTPRLRYRSVHKAGGKRIELGDSFPSRRRKRREGASNEFNGEAGGVIAGGQSDAGGYRTPLEGDGVWRHI